MQVKKEENVYNIRIEMIRQEKKYMILQNFKLYRQNTKTKLGRKKSWNST